jgi:uncharacterized membrane protein YsdA (DUF1294 family)
MKIGGAVMLLYVYAAFLLLMSLVTFAFYAADKHKARRGAYRTPERVLLSLSFFGGAIGGLAAMHIVRHKTKHWYFVVVNWLGFVLQMVLLAFLVWKFLLQG